MGREIIIAQIEPPQNLGAGDYYYRTHVPGISMAKDEGIYVVNLTNEHRIKQAVAAHADVLILKNICDPDFLPLIWKRKRQGRLTVYEIADDLDALQPWNPVYFFFKDQENRALVHRLASYCDALQVTCPDLKTKFGHLNRNTEVFPNQIRDVPRERPDTFKKNVVIGWGGSHGHLEDIREIADPLMNWITNQPNVSLHLMCSDPIWNLFRGLSTSKKKRIPTGTIDDYYRFLTGIDIGIAPLKDTLFNRSRSDIKFLEYAISDVVPVMQNLEPYKNSIDDGETGFLFRDSVELVSILRQLVTNPELTTETAGAARRYVINNRLQSMHTEKRLKFYRNGLDKMKVTVANFANRFETFSSWSKISGAVKNGRHIKLEPTRFELLLHDGLIAMQVRNDKDLACQMFEEAAFMEPENYLPLLFGTPVSKDPIGSLFKAIERKPDSLKAWIMLGEEFASKGRIKEALESFGSAIDLFPAYDIPILRTAAILKKIGQKKAAEKLYKNAHMLGIYIPQYISNGNFR